MEKRNKPKSINYEVGMRLQAAREKRGLTQEQFSEMLDITPHYLSTVERGVSGLALEKLRRACLLLGVSSDSLLFGPEAESNPALSRLSPQQRDIIDQILFHSIRLAETIPPETDGEPSQE